GKIRARVSHGYLVYLGHLGIADTSFGEQERHDEAHAPLGPAGGAFDVVAAAEREAHGVAGNLHDLPAVEVDRHRPWVIGPLVGGVGVDAAGEGVGVGVREEGLEERRVDAGAVGVAGVGPEVVGEQAVRPRALLPEEDAGRADAPLLAAEAVVGSGG